MTHTDFVCAVSRHCERLARYGTRPERVSEIRAALHIFLREVDQDMKDQPGLFEHPVWGSGRKPDAAPVPPALESAVADAARSLAPDVVRIRYTVGEDWSGRPAIHFRAVLSDAASQRSMLLAVTNRVEAAIRAVLDFDAMGLRDYYNFRSQSECKKLKDKDWE